MSEVGCRRSDVGSQRSERSAGLQTRKDSKDSTIYSYYFSYDGQGNVVQVSNKAGELPYHIYAYDSYGATTEGGGSYEGHLLASYKGYDRGTFGYKTGVRQYDPETGRFLSPDPFKGYMTDPASQHPYIYCRGNPVRYSDPSGYITGLEIAVGIGVGVLVYVGYGKAERTVARVVGVPKSQVKDTIDKIKKLPGISTSQLKKVDKVIKHFQKTYGTHVDKRCAKGKIQMAKEMDAAFGYDSDITFFPERRNSWNNYLIVRVKGIPGQIRLYMGSDASWGGKRVKYEPERTNYSVD